jgi:endonuclease/exonuclease/phosphatase (EEP) superfamily protein YafD
VVLVATLLAAATFLAPWSWQAELLASLRPHLVAAFALGVVACLLLLRPLPAVALVVLAGVLALPVVAASSGDRSVVAAGPTVTIAHQNAQGGFGGPVTILEQLAEHPTDVLVVLDPAPDWAIFLRGPAQVLGYEVVLPEDGPADAQALVLARVPVQAVAVPDGEGLPSASVALALSLGDQHVQLLGTHTRNPLTPARWRDRQDQLDAIADWARDQDGPAVVFGDLNMAPWSPSFARLERDSGLVSSGAGRPTQASWPWFPAWLRPLGIPIDHLLHSPELAVAERRVDPSLGSQHGVLVVELGLAP